MKDAKGVDLAIGDPVIFVSSRKKTPMQGVIVANAIGQMIPIRIEGDPFDVNVPADQVTYNGKKTKNVPKTAEKTSRKEIRRQAAALGIEGWDTMTTDELQAALVAAQTTTKPGKAKAKTNGHKASGVTKKPRGKTKYDVPEDEPEPDDDTEDEPETPVKASKAAPKKAKKEKSAAPVEARAKAVAENGNPFRKGSNLFIITEELLRGGRRKSIIERLQKKIELHPWSKKSKDIDPVYEMDKRMLLTKNLLEREYSFTFEMSGRGPENGSIKAFAPGTTPKASKTTPKAEKPAPVVEDDEAKPKKSKKAKKKGKKAKAKSR